MSKKISVVLIGVVALLAVLGAVNGPMSLAEAGKVPAKGMVTMVDLGATTCIPCKLMAPIMKKLERTYEGKAVIIFIDVRKHPRESRRFGIRVIPTQVFFDEEGKEVYRHEGFMSEAAIVRQLKKMGVE
jgi:thioredoxin 1